MKRLLIACCVLFMIATSFTNTESSTAEIKVTVSKRVEIIDIITGLKVCAGFQLSQQKIDIKDVILMLRIVTENNIGDNFDNK